jgi:hypothetical protein
MDWPAHGVARAVGSAAEPLRRLDWSLIALIAGFLLVAPVGLVAGNLSSPFVWLLRQIASEPFAAYEHAIAAAAVKRPEYRMKLATIDTEKVKVVSFRAPRPLDPQKRTFSMWVALPEELRAACQGAPDPVLRLQQVLGLPQTAAPSHVVTEVEVPRTGLFRPCIGRSALDQPMCEFDLPDPPAADADAATLRDAYERLLFGTRQMWSVYRTGFPRKIDTPLDYPFTGYPFTGMGWTYNWANASGGHYGVSEFIVKQDATFEIVSEKSPADFCGKPR